MKVLQRNDENLNAGDNVDRIESESWGGEDTHEKKERSERNYSEYHCMKRKYKSCRKKYLKTG